MKVKLSLIILSSFVLANDIDIGEIDVENTNNTFNELNNSSKYLSSKEFEIGITKQNKRIDEVLKQNSNINFNLNQANSKNTADISPKDFSINGAAFYQNAFLVDGLSIDNIIDPTWSARYDRYNVYKVPNLGSYGANINTNILKSIKVLDSNISAKYGDFEGGVVDAKLKDPTMPFAASLSTSYTDGNLNKILIDEKTKDDYKIGSSNYLNDNFVKQNHNIYLESKINDNYGFLFDYSRTKSINKKATKKEILDTGYIPPKEDKRSENFLLKGYFVYDNYIIKPSIVYTPSLYKGWMDGVLYSNLHTQYKELLSNLEIFSDYDDFNITHNLSYSLTKNSRTYDNHTGYYFLKNDIFNWGNSWQSGYGGLGNNSEKNTNIKYKLDLETEAKEFKNAWHKINLGLVFDYKKVIFDTSTGWEEYSTPRLLPNDYICQDSDKYCYMGITTRRGTQSNGQFLSEYYRTREFNINLNTFNFDTYLEDEINYKKFDFRIGARASYDGLIKRFNIAPRLSSEYDLSNDGSYKIGLGFNRYYGKSFFTYKLHDKIYQHLEFYIRNSPSEDFKSDGTQTDSYRFLGLKRPFTDEFSLFYKAELNDTSIGLKFLKRLGRNQVLTSLKNELGLSDIEDEKLDNNYRIYTNMGKSDTKILSFDIKKSFLLFNCMNSFDFSATYTKKKNNIQNYRDSTKLMNNNVKFEDKIIKQKDLPIIDFYDKYKLTLVHNFSFSNLNIDNIFIYTPNKKSLLRSYDSDLKMSAYKIVRLGDYFTWDMNISYKQAIRKNIEAFANLNITNILNTKNKINASKNNEKIIYDYASGRGITLEFGLNY